MWTIIGSLAGALLKFVMGLIFRKKDDKIKLGQAQAELDAASELLDNVKKDKEIELDSRTDPDFAKRMRDKFTRDD